MASIGYINNDISMRSKMPKVAYNHRESMNAFHNLAVITAERKPSIQQIINKMDNESKE